MHLLHSPLFILLTQCAFASAIPRYEGQSTSDDLTAISQPEWRHSQEPITNPTPGSDAATSEPVYKSRPCVLWISQTQELYSPILTDYGWTASLNFLTGESKCYTEYEIHPTTETFNIECDVFQNNITVEIDAHDVLDFKFGDYVWRSDDETKCDGSGWVQVHEKAKRVFMCVLDCGLSFAEMWKLLG